MKKTTLTILIILMLTLAACGASDETGSGAVSSNGPLPVQTQLLIGTFELEGSDQAVTAEQAAKLLPLWQVLQDLSANDAAAQEEIDALVEQIQETMTPEQMQAIAAMQLTQEDIFAVMQEQGITMGRGQGAAGGNSSGFTPPDGFTPPEGGMPPGGMPSEGFSGGAPGEGQASGGQAANPEQIATAQAARAQGGGFDRVPSGLMAALIQFLEEKAAS